MYHPNTSRRAFLCHSTALTALLALGGHRLATAQPIAGSLRILCSGPAGSIPDIVARRYAEQLAGRFSGGAVVDNRVGAAGQIAVGALKQASPDGTTILLAQGAIATVYPYLYARLAYEPAVDLKPVSMAAETALALAVGPGVPNSVVNLGIGLPTLVAATSSSGHGAIRHLPITARPALAPCRTCWAQSFFAQRKSNRSMSPIRAALPPSWT